MTGHIGGASARFARGGRYPTIASERSVSVHPLGCLLSAYSKAWVSASGTLGTDAVTGAVSLAD